jgi:hypothetical protein
MASNKVVASLLLPAPPVVGDEKAVDRFFRELVSQLSLILGDIVANFNELVDGRIDVMRFTVQHSEPVDAAEGWVAFADGTDWDPGSGVGLYEYSGSAWHKL